MASTTVVTEVWTCDQCGAEDRQERVDSGFPYMRGGWAHIGVMDLEHEGVSEGADLCSIPCVVAWVQSHMPTGRDA